MKLSLIILSTLGAVLGLPIKDISNKVCETPFVDIGGHCLLVETSESGSWDSMRSFCEFLGGRILKLDDIEHMYTIVNYLRDHGLDQGSFWIGGTDEGHEGEWKWTDGTAMRMGTPFWANHDSDNIQSPYGGSSQNCATMEMGFHYYFNDRMCSDDFFVICQQ